MPNMSYCRFQNTSDDLDDCRNAMDGRDEYYQCRDDLSDEEYRAFKCLVETCRDIVKMVENDNHVFYFEGDGLNE